MITLEQFYACVGGKKEEVVARMGGDENMVLRFLNKFLNDDSFSLLSNSLEKKDVQSAFRGAHSLKGVAASLGLQSLYTLDFSITELLRAGNLEDAILSFPELKKEYDQTCDLIMELA